MSTRILVVLLLATAGIGSRSVAAQDPDTASVLIDRVRVGRAVDLADSTARVDTSRVVEIKLLDGSVYQGAIVGMDPSFIRVRQRSGIVMEIPRAQVRSIVEVDVEEMSERFVRMDPNRTRLLFAPTARPLRHGHGYVSVYYIFFPLAAVGVLDRVNLAGGVSLIPGLPGQFVYAAPKVTLVETRNIDAAAGVLYATFVGSHEDGIGSVGLVYGLATAGSQERAVTFGAGLGFTHDGFGNRPALILGGETQLSDRIKLLTENYYISVDDEGGIILLSGAVRIFGDRLATDFGLITSPDIIMEEEVVFPFLPLVSFAYNFRP